MRVNREGRRGPGDPERAPRHAELTLVEGRAGLYLQPVRVLPDRGLEFEHHAAPAASNSPCTFTRPPTGSLTDVETKRTVGWCSVSKKSPERRCSSRLSLPVLTLVASIVSSMRRSPPLRSRATR